MMSRLGALTRQAALRFSAPCLALTLLAAPAMAESLSGHQLKSFISGKRVFIAVPMGGEIPLNYRSGGVVDGTGEAVGLGRYMAPRDSGRWWVDGARLCQKWREWYGGKTFCFTVSKLAPDRIRWVRDDGKSGVARVN